MKCAGPPGIPRRAGFRAGSGCCWLLLLWWALPAAAPPLVLDDKAQSVTLAPYLDDLLETERSLTLAEVASPEGAARFQPNRATVLNFGYRALGVWLRFIELLRKHDLGALGHCADLLPALRNLDPERAESLERAVQRLDFAVALDLVQAIADQIA
jgi:7TMR-DISM extracellular 2